MDEKNTPSKGKPKGGQSRDDRLKVALKANLARRKQQARARAAGSEGKEGK